jgi:NAD(P)-dependent dehydrogenase (short-subunit alcohol dehydrogenase family)
MSAKLEGKTALVLGGSRGIGRAVCLRLAADGARVIVHYHRRHEAAQEVASRIAGARIVQADMARPDSIDAMFAGIQAVRLDLLIINAGVWKPSPLGTTTVERMDEIVDTNLKGPFWVMQSALPLLNGGARVINLSSVAARTATAGGRSLYGAAKAAIDALTRNWALELAPRGILVNAVAPGYVPTGMTAEHFSDPDVYRRAMDRHPLGRMTSVEDVADVIAFLCSDDARFITGQSINVSGGFVV